MMMAGSFAAPLERRPDASRTLRYGLVVLVIAAPMGAVGYAYAHWVMNGLAWQWAVAALICIGAGTAAMFEGRIIPMFCAKIALWSSFGLLAPNVDNHCCGGRGGLGLVAHCPSRMDPG